MSQAWIVNAADLVGETEPMCRRKPGRRCPSCQQKAIAAAQAHLERVVSRMQTTKDGSEKRTALEATARDIARDLQCRHADLYATRQFQEATEKRLVELLDNNPKDPEISRLAAQLAEGRILERYRGEQAALMPPQPSIPSARTAHNQLGDARFDMAHARLRMDSAGADRAEWQLWQQRHLDAAQRASLAAAQLSAIEDAGSADGWKRLTAEQQRARRDALADNGTFDTPIAPRNYRDVMDETQDILDGLTPVREPVDDAGFAPFGPTEPRLRDATHAGTPGAGTSDTDNPDGGNSNGGNGGQRRQPQPRTTTRQEQLAKQSRRRTRRSRGMRTLLRDVRRNQGYFTRMDRRLDPAADAVAPKQLNESGALLDMTFLSLLIEAADRARR